MSFNNNDFVDFLEFFKDSGNFPDNAKNSYQTVTEVSKSEDNGKSVIYNDNYIFNLDNMCGNVHIKDNGHVKSNRPLSVDGLYFLGGHLYLIEFKGTPISYPDSEEILNIWINFLNEQNYGNYDNSALINALKIIKNRYNDEILCNLKIKPSDSLFLTLPLIYNYYCKRKGIDCDREEFLSWLMNVPKRLFVVFLNDDRKSERNESKSYKYLRMDKKLEKRYAPFKSLVNMENSIVNQEEFENVFLGQFFNA
ncbi:MAG: hypothetical protein IJ672_08900 [Methanobrevibacter sp.]|nr:hypothetical protein [Methanobrevibacter sp.]MBR1611581.1 hypothetical protein [Methanobrevibacter sp.]